MKRFLFTAIIISLFVSASWTVYGADEFDVPTIYVSIVMHNEEPGGGGYPDFVNDPKAFFIHRKALVRFVHMLHANGAMLNFQSDWNFLQAVALYDRGAVETNGKNIVRYIKEDLGFEVDPHAHETLYNYADVAYLIEALGVAPSGTVGGFQAAPPKTSKLEYLWQPMRGSQYPDYTWQAEILWGGASLSHLNEEPLWASGVWKPKGRYHFLEHDDNAPLPFVGGFGRGWEKLKLLLKMQQNGELEKEKIYTCSIFLTQSNVLKPEFIKDFEEQIKAHDRSGDLLWAGLAQVVDIWQTEYSSVPNILPYIDISNGNLLSNPGFEDGGDGQPHDWAAVTLPGGTGSPVYTWESGKSHNGSYSVKVESSGSKCGMWQQTVGVLPGTVYTLSGHVSFENIIPPGQCNLQVVFRDGKNHILEFVDLPAHDSTRAFDIDFPHNLKFRAPDDAATAEVNCFLQGPGVAWFDDILFAPALLGKIAGQVTCDGQLLDGARVWLFGDPWGKTYETYTNKTGQYVLEDVPVAFPRYVMMAEKEGFKSKPAGDVTVRAGGKTMVDFQLTEGRDPTDVLRVKFGCLELNYYAEPNEVPIDAVIPSDPEGYPEFVCEFLKADQYITSNDPAIIGLADQILSSLDPADRNNTYKVAWAAYEWIAKQIKHDAVFAEINQSHRDVTSGIYQTIGDGGWAWGKNSYDWCYKPAETLAVKSALSVEHSWLSVALLRALHIPARGTGGSAQFWVQKSGEYGFWVGLSTSAGSNAYRKHGILGPGFGGLDFPAYFSVTSEPVLHEDWAMKNKCLWHEKHPWEETYPATEEGLALALTHMDEFMTDGNVLHGQACPPDTDRYKILYRDITINLDNMGSQLIVDVRFPMISESDTHYDMRNHAYWSNHPECIERTYMEEITNSPVEGKLRWFHIVFDLTSLVGPLDLTW